MYPYIETYLGMIEDVTISVISNNNNTHEKKIDAVIKDNGIRMFEFFCESNDPSIDELINGSCVTIQCTLPEENRFGIIEYDVTIDADLFETIFHGLIHGFYDQLIGSVINHYVHPNHFSTGFKQATENYKHHYDNGDERQWGIGLQNLK